MQFYTYFLLKVHQKFDFIGIFGQKYPKIRVYRIFELKTPQNAIFQKILKKPIRPADRSTDRLADRSAGRPIGRPTGRPIDRSAGRPIRKKKNNIYFIFFNTFFYKHFL